MIRKVMILIPLLVLAGLVKIILAVITEDSADSDVHAEPNEVTKLEKLEKPRKVLPIRNHMASSQQKAHSTGRWQDFGYSSAVVWHELSTEEKYSSSVYSVGYDIVISVVPEINYLESQLDGQWKWKFDALQETTH